MTKENKLKSYLQCRISDDDILKLIKEKLEKSTSDKEACYTAINILDEVSSYIFPLLKYLVNEDTAFTCYEGIKKIYKSLGVDDE